jgi:hypothetical protein
MKFEQHAKPVTLAPVAPAPSYAHREPKKTLLDTATCARNTQGMCNILRTRVPKRFSLAGEFELENEMLAGG